jgi:hypothetical protein
MKKQNSNPITRAVFLTVLLLILGIAQLQAQKPEHPKVVLITLDGYRWQELFTGADPLLIANKDFVEDTMGLKERFWRSTAEERRAALMPFVWDSVVKMGQIHGNRNKGSKVDLTNKMWFSYPGYNEILTGSADDARIVSNDKIDNPNITLLELANKSANHNGKIAAFGSWDVFPYIINEGRSGVPVNAGFENATGTDLTLREIFLNELQPRVPSPWGSVRLDAFTHYYALEYIKKNHPELVYIAYGETDDFAHDGDYQAYLRSAHTTDAMIKELWDFTQKDPFYKGQTVFIITTDHGRGTRPLETWKGHGDEVQGAGEVWLVVFGNGILSLGEIEKPEQLYSNQIAPTVIQLLGLEIERQKMPGPALELYPE